MRCSCSMIFESGWKRFKKVFNLQINCVEVVFSERLKCGILHVNTDLLLYVTGNNEKSRVFVSFRTYCLCCVLEEYSLLIIF